MSSKKKDTKKAPPKKDEYEEDDFVVSDDDDGSGDEDNSPKKRKTTDDKGKKGSAKKEKTEVISEKDFLKQAKPIKVTINGTEFTADPKTFTTGSYGWGLAGKVLKVKVGSEEVACQISLNLPVRGSKQ
eukprot:TRINITY_DN133408_c0_g1_i1.p1 TRINITY_DN133408_c0_g1~~TRINITY_DN133408_c0_g1_i1.p1  ORF type:complete len:129 (+),score=60.36 TRINITY_DN133408_c0_g1_i1:2-388(+)